ncbi:MAG: glucosaminidase domain-containing protein [Ktedonobacteraceae bacterium]|nr:glucosaminidase domain-containing protein [Ktedonobacteraceae bacterium]
MANTQIGRKQVRPTIFLVGCLFLILLGAATTFFWQAHSELPARAASGDVVGPPTLPAATVDSILASMGSPMVGTGAIVEQASRQTNIDDAFALAVWWTETNDGAAGVGLADRNPGSVRGSYGYPAAFDGYTIYSSYAAGIIDWFNLVRTRYVDRGLTSAYTICYPYVGTSSSYQWAIKVVNLMIRYRGEAPPPPPPAPTPIPTPNAVLIQHIQVHAVKPKPAVMGLTREEHIPGNVVSPITTRLRIADNGSVQASAVATSMPPALPFIILLGLLAALLIALWGVKIGRSISSTPPASGAAVQPLAALTAWDMTPLPALYANEFSPVLLPQTEQLPWEMQEQPQPVANVAAPAANGWMKSYADSDVLPRKSKLRPMRMVSGPQSSDGGNWPGSLPETPIGFLMPVNPVQQNVLEPVGAEVRPLGLLSRYAREKENNREWERKDSHPNS